MSHQHIGYLWPMGPWFWAFDALGVPTWVAQRLWLGTLAMAAALGARWLLGSPGAEPGRRAGRHRRLPPHARTSSPSRPGRRCCSCRGPACRGWSGSPIGPSATAGGGTRRGSRSSSSPSAPSTRRRWCWSGIGPLVWLLAGHHEPGRGAAGRRGGGARRGARASGCRSGGSRRCASRRPTGCRCCRSRRTSSRWPPPRRRATCSAASATGSSTGRTASATRSTRPSTTSRDLPTVVGHLHPRRRSAWRPAIVVRWRHRARFVALVLVGTVVAVGAWPLDDPSPFAHAVAEFTDTSAGLALRNTARAAPVLVLGPGRACSAPPSSACRPAPASRWGAAALVGLLVVGGLRPVWSMGLLSRAPAAGGPGARPTGSTPPPRSTPAGTDTRVLELPGLQLRRLPVGQRRRPDPARADGARASWRGRCCRRARPARRCCSTPSTAGSRRAPSSRRPSRPVARPASAWATSCSGPTSSTSGSARPTPAPSGSQLTGAGRRRGSASRWPTARRRRTGPTPPLPMVDEVELRTPRDAADPPPGRGVPGGEPAVDRAGRARPPGRSCCPATATASSTRPPPGWSTARSLRAAVDVRSAPTRSTDALDGGRRPGGRPTPTGGASRRGSTPSATRAGPTEQAGETLDGAVRLRLPHRPDPGARRRPPHRRGAGGRRRSRPPPAAAPTGPRTGPPPRWTATCAPPGGSAARTPRGTVLRLTVPDGVTADHLTLVQPQDGPRDRALTEVRIRIDGGPAFDVALTEASLDRHRAGGALPGAGRARGGDGAHRRVDAARSTPPSPTRSAWPRSRLGDVVVEEWVRVPTGLIDRRRRRRGPPARPRAHPPPLRAGRARPAGPGARPAPRVRPPRRPLVRPGRHPAGGSERPGRGARRGDRHRRSTGPS